jgi:hypothetical protein
VLTTDGAGVTTWTTPTSGANTNLSNLDSPTAIDEDLRFGVAAKTLVLQNDTFLKARNDLDTLDVDILKLTTGNYVDMDNINNISDSGNGLTLESTSASIEIEAAAAGQSLFLIADFLDVYGGGATAATMRFYENSGTNFVGLKSPASVTSDFTLTLPPNDGGVGEVLQTNGSGITTWTSSLTGSSGSIIASYGTMVNQQSSWGNDLPGVSIDGDSSEANTASAAGISFEDASGINTFFIGTSDSADADATSGFWWETGYNTFTSGATGTVNIRSGQITNASNASQTGNIVLSTGPNSGTGASGNIQFVTGTSSTSRGDITLNAKDVITNELKSGLSGSLVTTSWAADIPGIILDGTTTAATTAAASGIILNADASQSELVILTKDQTGSTNSSPLNIQTGTTVNGQAGTVNIDSGSASGSGNGGAYEMQAGSAAGAGNGGSFNIEAGASDSGSGGNVNINAGASTSGADGTISLVGTTVVSNGGLKPNSLTADPCADTAAYPEGSQFYNNTSDYYCFCNGAGNDVQMHSPATACF